MGEEIKKTVKAMGAEIKGWYMLMGQYDEICILEAPDAETVGRAGDRLDRQIWRQDRNAAGLQPKRKPRNSAHPTDK